MPGLLGGQLLVARQLPPHAHHPLQLRRRTDTRELEQLRLAVGRSHARQRPHLGIGDAPLPQRVGRLGQFLQRTGGADPFARRADLDADPPGQPLGTGTEAVLPAAPAVEVGDEVHHLRLRGVDARGQLRDALAEPGEFVGGLAGPGTGGSGDGIGPSTPRFPHHRGPRERLLASVVENVRGCDHHSSQHAIVQ